MNQYLRNLNKIEFVVTNSCTGRCKHCSEGDHVHRTERIDPTLASDAVLKVAAEYDIKTVMTFGGEPLLHTDAVYAVMNAAKEMNINRRQVITNGYFSSDPEKIREVAMHLLECGVNDLLLSVDAFHQEFIPIETVKIFAEAAVACGIPMRLSPAWLVSPDHANPYNEKTRQILMSLAYLNVPTSAGNIVFPEGNARKFLVEYFIDVIPENPYRDDPCDVKCLSFSPNGDVLGANAHEKDVMEIIKDYDPKRER